MATSTTASFRDAGRQSKTQNGSNWAVGLGVSLGAGFFGLEREPGPRAGGSPALELMLQAHAQLLIR